MISSAYQSFYHCFSSLSAAPAPTRSDASKLSEERASAECICGLFGPSSLSQYSGSSRWGLAGCSRSLRVSLLVVPTAASGTNIAARWLLVRQRDRVQGVPVRFLSKVE